MFDPKQQQSPLTESNRRPFPYHGNALPTELRGRSLETNFAVFQSTLLRSVEASHSLTQFIISTQIASSTIVFPPFKSTLGVIRRKGMRTKSWRIFRRSNIRYPNTQQPSELTATPAREKPHTVIRVGFCTVPGRRFELLKAMPADLQSAPFGRSGNLACTIWCGFLAYYKPPANLQISTTGRVSTASNNHDCQQAPS